MAEIYERVAIGELQEKTSLEGSDQIALEDAEGTKKATLNTLKTFLEKDTGWMTLTPDGNYEVVYGHRPQVRKRGNVVELSGGVRNTKNNIGGSTTEVRIGITLPEEYRPSKMVICPGYTNVDKVFQLHVNVDGTVTVSRAFSSDSGGYESIQANTAIFFHVVYFTD